MEPFRHPLVWMLLRAKGFRKWRKFAELPRFEDGMGLVCHSGTAFGILSEMFSEAVLDHFRNPRNAGEVPDATAIVEVSNPVCGDILKLSARIVDGHIAEARFLCRGCTTSIACASVLTEQLGLRTIAEVRSITPESLSAALGGLPPATFHGAQLAADALAALREKLVLASR